MILRGILDHSLNGQICIRGFAPIKELARISKADYSYQRSPINRSDITDFLENQSYLFFPEIILGYKFRHSFAKGKSSLTPMKSVPEGKSYKSNVDNTQIKFRTVDYKQSQDIRGENSIQVAELVFDDVELSKLIQDNMQPLSRIDGNHRLRAAESVNSSKVERMIAPFCIILGEEIYGSETLNAINEFDKATKVFFHNINTKTIPLTSEENLKVLIDDQICFPDNELKDILGKEGVLVRQLIEKYNYKEFTGIEHIIGDNFRSCYLDIFNILEGKNKNVNKVLDALKSVDRLYADNDRLKANSSFGLLYAFLYYWILDKKGKFSMFKNWVLNNNLFETEEVLAENLIKIFDKIAEQEIMVFIAMPYFSDEEVEAHNDIYKTVIEDLKNDYHINIGHYEIMKYQGKTVDITQDILNKIEECGIFVANITNNNPNVTYEMGWARALRKPTILVREEKSKEPKSDYKMLYHATYKKEAHTTLKKTIRENMEAILAKEYGYVLDKS
ncbi:nucleoside 2-deoxyribosyltransferase [Bacteroides sp. 14(A)]|uniref:nucleoside 2-deoxyribosyltransferase n=1 Tax=Bacteroides sp. 14(A) TaxID=1163670 RepID=UPI000494ABC0|nr:nucleoside 2-deoxyribosyltransferase [Bacteroides sp. 14(A)]